MSKAHAVRTMLKDEAKRDKTEEVAYVRKEKAAEEAMMRRLAEVYGDGSNRRDDGRRRHAWRCQECKFANYESRIACASCLAVPDTWQGTKLPNVARPAVNTDATATITRVAGRCYRSYAAAGVPTARPCHAARGGGEYDDEPGCPAPAAVGTAWDEDADDYADCDDDAADDDGPRVARDAQRGDYFMRMPCPARYHGFIIGQKGRALAETQRLTGATIIIPKKADSAEAGGAAASELDGDTVEIRGETINAVRAAQIRIEGAMYQNKDRVEYTHFVSIPLAIATSARAAFASAIDDMLHACVSDDACIDATLFQKPSKVHLTLLMLRLHSEEQLATAKMLLKSLELEVQHIFAPTDRVTVKGLNYMNDDPSEVHVVYAEIERDPVFHKLQGLITRINRAFIDAGLAQEKDVAHNDKLHATLINSKWRGSGDAGSSLVPSSHDRLAFDATHVLRLFGKHHFGCHALTRIDLSRLGGGTGPDGYFSWDAFIEFPLAVEQ